VNKRRARKTNHGKKNQEDQNERGGAPSHTGKKKNKKKSRESRVHPKKREGVTEINHKKASSSQKTGWGDEIGDPGVR